MYIIYILFIWCKNNERYSITVSILRFISIYNHHISIRSIHPTVIVVMKQLSMDLASERFLGAFQSADFVLWDSLAGLEAEFVVSFGLFFICDLRKLGSAATQQELERDISKKKG